MLSCILARQFIECWETLKDSYYHFKANRTAEHRPTTNTAKIEGHSKYKIKTQSHSRVKGSRDLKERLNTSSFHRMHPSITHSPESNRSFKAKSVRNFGEADYERANVLQEIVDKLKDSHRNVDIGGEVGLEVLRKVSRLEKMLRNIKLGNSSGEKGTAIETERYQRAGSQRNEDDEAVREFMREIKDMRREVAELKANSEEMLKQ